MYSVCGCVCGCGCIVCVCWGASRNLLRKLSSKQQVMHCIIVTNVERQLKVHIY